MTTQDKVREFHEKFGHPIGEHPKYLELDRWELRTSLIREEAEELFSAPTMEDEVDALADLVYVCYGMAIEMGVDLDDVISEVHAANMRKLGPDGKPIYRDDGKILKPEGWEGPDIGAVLARQAARERPYEED